MTPGLSARLKLPFQPPPQRCRMAMLSGAMALALLLAGCASDYRYQAPPPILLWNPSPVTGYTVRQAPPDVPPSYLVLLPNADGSTGKVTLQSNQGRQTLNRAKEGADLQGGGASFPVTDAQIKRDFGAAMAARPALPEHFRIYFETGTSRLTRESTAVLNAIIRRSQTFSALEVEVIGHTDTQGEAEANFELGLKRARAFAQTLVAQGIRAVSLEIGSDGESLPLVPTPDNTAEPRNRRVEVTLR